MRLSCPGRLMDRTRRSAFPHPPQTPVIRQTRQTQTVTPETLRFSGNKLKAGLWAAVAAGTVTLPWTLPMVFQAPQQARPKAASLNTLDEPITCCPGKRLSYDEFVTWTNRINDLAEQKNEAELAKTQTAFNQKLQEELIPTLQAVLNPRNKNVAVVLGSGHSNPNWEEFTMDGGRGLPIVYRYKVNVSANPNSPDIRRVALITFMDYNPQRKRFEIVNAEDGNVNDAFRLLVETEPLGPNVERGFIGASFQAKVKDGNIVSVFPVSYYTTKGDVAPANPRGKILPDELRPIHCIQCHSRTEDTFFRTNFELKRHAHHHPDTRSQFLTYLDKMPVPTEEKDRVAAILANPTAHRAALVPPGLFNCVCECMKPAP